MIGRSVWKIAVAVMLCMLWACPLKGQVPQQEVRILCAQQTTGYGVVLPYPYRKVRQKWWAFLKTLGGVSLTKDCWQVHIKAGQTLYTAIARKESSEHSILYVGIASNIGKEAQQEYDADLHKMLRAFVRATKKDDLAAQLKTCEKTHQRKSQRMEKLRQKQQAQKSTPAEEEEIRTLQAAIESLTHQQTTIIEQLAALAD